MQKVKRKQIDFGGTDKQYVRGDGELGELSSVDGGGNGVASLPDGFYFPNALKDKDDNWYGAVVIGNQIWLAENYRCTRMPDGTPIPNGSAFVNDGVELTSISEPYYYWTGNNEGTINSYGLKYNFSAISDGETLAEPNAIMKGIAPTIWHIPSPEEYKTLLEHITSKDKYKVTAANGFYTTPVLANKSSINSTTLAQMSDDEIAVINATGFGFKDYMLMTNKLRYASDEDIPRERVVVFFQGDNAVTDKRYNAIIDTELSSEIPAGYGEHVRFICDLNPIQFRNWYIAEYGSMQHHLDEGGNGGNEGDEANIELSTLTIKQNNETIDTYNPTSDTNKIINISIPSSASDIDALPTSTLYGASLDLYIDPSTFVITGQLLDQYNNPLGTQQTIDLPLESVVVDGDYDEQTGNIILTLQNNNTIEFPVTALVNGLKNVQADWNETDPTSDSYIKNKPTIPEQQPTISVRSINKEEITDSTLGDINLYDGFYFPNAISDYDGNWYGAVVIGDQVWLAENLRSTHYSNGVEIPKSNSYESSSGPMYYNYLRSNIPLVERGYLYNWYAVMNGETYSNSNSVKGISPGTAEAGNNIWHIPSDAELQQLCDYVGKQKRYIESNSSYRIGKALASQNYWSESLTADTIGYNPETNNKTGFSVVPAGNYDSTRRYCTHTGIYSYIWTSQESSEDYALFFYLNSAATNVSRGGMSKSSGCSVRCISKLNPIQFRNWYVKQYGSLQHHIGENNSGGSDTQNLASLTISKNSTVLDTYTPNGVDKNINITVPVSPSDIGALSSDINYASSLSLTINPSTFVVTGQLNDQNNNPLGTPQVIDLPLESVVVDGTYDSVTENIILTLQNGNTITFPISALVRGLTNVQSDWNQTDSTKDDYIKNKPTIPEAVTVRTMNHEQLTDSSLGDINIHDGFYFPNAVQDADGNWYGAVVVGDQVWLRENFRCTRLPDGTPIANGSASANSGTTQYGTTPYYYWYDNNGANVETDGLYYNPAAYMNGSSSSNANPSGVQGIAPSGWHIPSPSEFEQIARYIENQKRYESEITIDALNGDDFQEIFLNTLSVFDKASFGSSSLSSLTNAQKESINATNLSIGATTERLATSQIIYQTTNPYDETAVCLLPVASTQNVNQFASGIDGYNAIEINGYNFGIDLEDESYGAPVRLLSDLTPVQFRNWYIEQYGSLQHHIVDIPEQIQSDWTELDPTSDAYIKNKPTIPTVPNHRTINHEIITYSSNSVMVDINLHDGYYFPNAVQDYDGNWYGAIILGDQVWLAENLRTKHFADGTPIDDGLGILSDTTPYYIDYTASSIPIEKRGLIYNWPAVMNGHPSVNTIPSNIKDIAPGNTQDGTDIWHIPSYKEFSKAWQYIFRQKRFTDNGNGTSVGSAKPIASTEYWRESSTPNTPGYEPDKNNSTGFNIYPTPSVDTNGEIATTYTDTRSFFWTTSLQEAADTTLVHLYGVSYDYIGATTAADHQYNYRPIRCVCDLDPVQFRAWYVKTYGSMQHHIVSSQIQSDWNQSDSTQLDFIKNKPNFVAGGNIIIETDANNNVKISEKANHTVIARNSIVNGPFNTQGAQNGTKAYSYTVRCDLNNKQLTVADISEFCNSQYITAVNNNFIWEKTSSETNKYAGILGMKQTEGTFVFKLNIHNQTTQKDEEHIFCVLADCPPDASFVFVTTCNWDIIIRMKSEPITDTRLYAYLKIPDDFVGTIELIPLRCYSRVGTGWYYTFDYENEISVNYEYSWQSEHINKRVNTVANFIAEAPNSTAGTIRQAYGNYFVNIVNDFDNTLAVGTKINDNIINDYFLHTLEDKVQTLSSLPQPTAADAGKVLMVNAQGQYELVSLNQNS